VTDDEMEKLQAAIERDLAAAWTEAVEWMREHNQIDDIADRIGAGDLVGAIAGVKEAAERVAAAIAQGYIDAGQAEAAWLDKLIPKSLITFDVGNPRAVAWQQRNKLERIAEIIEEQREVLQSMLVRGTYNAANPRVTARDLRTAIGLTAKQEGHVASYRAALESGDYANAIGRELGDGRFDRSLRVAARDGKTLQAAQIDRMVEAYRRNWVRFRAETIAQTEGLKVLHQGSEELFQQAIDAGKFDVGRIVQRWIAAHDGRTRSSHRAMDGQKRLWGHVFTSGDGYSLRYPGDPNAPRSEIIRCRCRRTMRLMASAESAIAAIAV
jgi:hypothetical protein